MAVCRCVGARGTGCGARGVGHGVWGTAHADACACGAAQRAISVASLIILLHLLQNEPGPAEHALYSNQHARPVHGPRTPPSRHHPAHVYRFFLPSIVSITLPHLQKSLFSCRPDGQKKAYVRLTPDCDAVDVANRIGII